MFVCPQCGAPYHETGFCGSDGTKLNAIGDDRVLGTTIGAYRIAALIGLGGWGRVYLGVQPEIGSRVAIKVLKQDPTGNPTMVNRFFNEARAVNLIRHENIVNIIDLAQLPDGRMYITMEYLDGLPLSKFIANKGRLGISETCRICSQVLDALAAAHEKGIIHRDLKPDNLFISPEGRAKILDFGIAKLRDDENDGHTREGSLIGTPHFMSPEQALGQPVDPRSDLYSMGLILYNCLTGSVPFEAPSAVALARAHVERAPDPVKLRRPDVPEELDALVLRALAKDPKDRWQAAETMGTALKRIAHANPGNKTRALSVPATPIAIDPTLPADAALPEPVPPYATAQGDEVPPKKSRKAWLAIAALLLVGAAASVALLASRGSGAEDASATANGAPGASIENARPINFSAPIEGIVDTVPQHYRFDAVVGQQLVFIIHTGAANGSSPGAVQVTLVTAGGKKLALEESESPDTGSTRLSFVAQEAQSVVITITNRAKAPTPFKVTTEATGPTSAGSPGGLTMESAPRINLASPIEGAVGTEQSRHYRVLASPGQTTLFTIYTDLMQPETYAAQLVVKVKAEDGSLLQETGITTLAHLPNSKPHKAILEFVTVQAQSVLVTIENRSNESAVHYKIESSPVSTSTELTGGLTPETAELVDFAEDIIGVVNKEQTRFYRFNSLAGQSYESTVTPQIMQTKTYAAKVSLRITGEKATLGALDVTTLHNIKNEHPKSKSILFTTVEAQSVLVAIGTTSTETPVRYTIASKKVGPSFPLSGGPTPEAAELVDLKGPIEGVIAAGESRHYRFTADTPQTTTFTTYTELMRPQDYNASLLLSATAEDGATLGQAKLTTLEDISTPAFAKQEASFVSVEPGSVLLTVKNTSEASPVHYRFVPKLQTVP